MKTNPGLFFAVCSISTVLTLLAPLPGSGQNTNPPFLTITPQREPQVSVYGLAGARYELQYTPTLSTSNWQVLTNFILGTSPFSVVDSNAPLAGIRMYRALLLETNASVNYAPTTLSPAEIFRFSSQSGPAAFSNVLVLNSATTGMLVRQDNSPNNGISLVTVSYNRVGPFLAGLTVVRPAADGLPTAQTNFYTLVFTGPGSGFFQFTDGPTAVVGEFSRDQSFIGQQMAPAQLTAGESYSLLFTNSPPGITNLTTLVINSATSGMLISPGNPPPASITPVSIEYQPLGPLSSQLQVVIPPSSGFITPQTNFYYLVFVATNSGTYQSISGPAMVNIGPFTRDQSLVGQQIAPAQLTAGESYSLLSTNAGITNSTTLVINSVTSGTLISPGNPPPGSITPVSIEYQLLGPLSSQMQVIIPPGSGFINPQTNFYYFVYATTNSGAYQSLSGPAMVTIGPFTRDRSLVGQPLAPAQLTAGESYSLLSTNAGITNLTTLVINSTTNGMLISVNGPVPSITPVTIEYQLLGPLSSQLQVVIPASSGFPMPQTNYYYLVFATANSGSYQSVSGPAMNNLGPFTRDASLVGQQIALAQLTAGEIYGLLNTNMGSYLTTLVINSPADGMLVSPGNPPPAGANITTVAIDYLRLGPLASQLQVVIPPSVGFPMPRTNWHYLVYSSPNSGVYQSITDGPMGVIGPFTRNQSLVGQQIAPLQPTAGESYRLASSNGPSVLVETLVVNSATNGILVVESSSPEAGIYPNVTLQYLALGNLAAQCQVVIPATPPMILTARTNTYLLVYTSNNAGQFQRTSDPAMTSIGEFLRNPAQ